MNRFILFFMALTLHVSAEMQTIDDRSAALKQHTVGWGTNWNKHTISYDELLSGGPSRDGIPSIDKPKFVNVQHAKQWIGDNEPVVLVKIGSQIKAYPIQILIWHEIVNDTLGGKPILVSFCPLCNSAIVFDRAHAGTSSEFGTSGLLRNSDLVMYDRQSETLWQQFTGESIVGDRVGERLPLLPSSLISFRAYYTAYPQGLVLSKDTGFNRRYGDNPYVGYDDITQSPFLYNKPSDSRLKPMQRVLGLHAGKRAKAYPADILAQKSVINDRFDGEDIVIFHQRGTSSALDTKSLKNAKDVGATTVFSAKLEGKVLTFVYTPPILSAAATDTGITDVQTGSSWTLLGKAIRGKLKGKALTQKIHADYFWFSFAAFYPDTEIYIP